VTSGQEIELERAAIERLRAGDIDALQVLVQLHQARAMRTAYLVTRDAALAQDIVQSAFLRAYERIGQLDPHRPFGPWFCTAVLRDAIKLVARRARQRSLDEDSTSDASQLIDPGAGPEAIWERTETADEVWRALAHLTPEQRAAIVARYYVGLSEAETSRVLACATSTLKWRLHAARARLRVLLAPALGAE
jgi:RNA polymerase sigma-70 factor (ECF subfamily)